MKTPNGKISVVLAIYNVAPYLRQCLNSIVNQTYRNLEIICVDDGSTDESGAICDEYAARDDRMVVIHQKNQGVSSARNRALSQITGQYVYFTDSDDWLELDMLETLHAMMDEDHSVQITQCGYFFDYPDHCQPVKNHLSVPETPLSMRDFLYYVYRRDEYRGVASYLWCKLFPSCFFDGRIAMLRFASNLCMGEDVILAAQCYLLADKTRYTSRPLYHYRQQEGSAMHNMDRRLQGLGSPIAYERVIQLFEDNGIGDDVLDYVKRFYVYHCGVLLEYALKIGDREKISILKQKVYPYLAVYQRTNPDHPERYQWICGLLNAE